MLMKKIYSIPVRITVLVHLPLLCPLDLCVLADLIEAILCSGIGNLHNWTRQVSNFDFPGNFTMRTESKSACKEDCADVQFDPK